jgi:GH15 family glucan-1,4-alpha-glucosidase
MRSIALVGMNGSVDFLCYPDFDSPTVFAALLDDERGGRFQIEPRLKNRRVRQLYLPDTNILITRFLAEEGVAELTDYMPIGSDGKEPNEIIRTVTVVRGVSTVPLRGMLQAPNLVASDAQDRRRGGGATFVRP